MRLTVAEIAAAVGGRMAGTAAPTRPVTGVTWDSRAVKTGDLYVCLPGERVDGHDFAASAVDAGAAAVLAERPTGAFAPEVVVDDAASALSTLASFWRGRLEGTVVGLTGSSGKTTTKNLVRDVLARAGSVVATRANQNNELGVPNTLLAADADTAHVVVEMGMRGAGQIAELCEVARPDWGLVTNVGESHIELLGSREAIAHAKAELLSALPDGRGIAFVNAADGFAAELCAYARLAERGVRIVFFEGGGSCEHAFAPDAFGADGPKPFVWASDVALDEFGRASFTMHAGNFEEAGLGSVDGICRCTLTLGGIHNVSNACAAAAVGLVAGISLEECCAALGESRPEQGRGGVLRGNGGLIVVDDAYNANPDSMAASLSTFAALGIAGKRIAVLGDMLELGDFAREGHERMGRVACALGVDTLVCVGELAHFIGDAAIAAGMPADAVSFCGDAREALELVSEIAGPDDAVLAKASHAMRLDLVVEGLVS